MRLNGANSGGAGVGRNKRGDNPLTDYTVSWRMAAFLTVLAFVHRFFFFHSNTDADWAFSVFYEGDAEIFHNYARAIRAGQSYDGGVPFHPPGFPYFLSLVHALTGAGAASAPVNHVAVRLFLAGLSSMAVGAVYVVATPFIGRLAATLGAGFLLYSFGHYVISVNPTSEGTAIVVTLIAIGVWTRLMPGWINLKPCPRRAALLGLVGGLLILTRAEAALLMGAMVALGALSSWRTERTGRALVPWGIALAVGVLTILPWTLRNQSRLSEINRQLGPQLSEPIATFVPVTVYGPLNLALANHAGADGTFSRDILAGPTGSSQLDLKNPQHLYAFNHGDRMAWDWVRAHPGDFAALVVRKWTLASEALGLGFTQWNVPAGLHGVRRPVDSFVTPSPIGYLLMLPLIVFGIGVLIRGDARGRRWLLVVSLVTGASAVVVGLFFGYARFGVMLLPFWFTLSGVALAWLIRRFGGTGTPRLRHAGIGFVVVLLVLEAWGGAGSRAFDARGSGLTGAEHLNPHSTIRLDVQRK